MMTANETGRLFPLRKAMILAVLLTSAPLWAAEDQARTDDLPPLPDKLGFAGPLAGVSKGALLVGGGANFPEAVWGEGTKTWHDGLFVLAADAKEWKSGFRLPRKLAYGVSATVPQGIICAGGSDSERAYADAFLLQWTGQDVRIIPLPPLPAPRAAAAGAVLKGYLYVAGGQTATAETEVANTFWRLKLPDAKETNPCWDQLKWEQLESWPGPPRSQAVAAAQAGKFHLFSGFDLTQAEGDDKPRRRYLNDAYSYDPARKQWKRLADVPAPAVAAAPAAACGESHILILGGHDGTLDTQIPVLKDRWPGFRKQVLAYHTITDTWTPMGELPMGLVTSPAVWWQGRIIVPGGEVRPRVRTPQLLTFKPRTVQRDFFSLDYVVLGGYLVLLVGVGIYFSRREKTTEDYFIGGKRVPWWAAGLSIFGTQLSSISFMAIPAKVYDTDWAYFLSAVAIVLVLPLVVYFYLPFFRRLNITSAYEYLERRFHVTVRMFGSAAFILFQAGRMTIVLFLPALALSAVTGLDIRLAIVVMGALTTLYTVLGGIEAVIWTDVLQVVVLVGGALACLVAVVFGVGGGLDHVLHLAQANNKLSWGEWSWDYTFPVVWVVLVGAIFQSLSSYSADQTVIQRYLTTSTQKQAARAIWTNAVIVVPVSLLWFALGTALYAFYKIHPAELDVTLKTDQILPLFIANELPAGLTGLVIAALFAAAMSTLDSSMNSISTAFVTDFYRRLRPRTSDRTCLNLARGLTLLLGVAATGTALWMAANQERIRSLWDAYMSILGLLMGVLAGLFALGIFTRRANWIGALVGAVGGAGILYYVQQTRLHFFLYAGVGVGACFGVGYLASLLMPRVRRTTEGLTVFTMPPAEDTPSPGA